GDPKTETIEEGLRPGQPAAQGPVILQGAKNEIVGNAQFLDQRIVLIDRGESEAVRKHRIGVRQRLSHNVHATLVGCDRAARDAEKGALARTVFAENCVNLARPALEIDVGQRLYARIALRYSSQFKRSCSHRAKFQKTRGRFQDGSDDVRKSLSRLGAVEDV